MYITSANETFILPVLIKLYLCCGLKQNLVLTLVLGIIKDTLVKRLKFLFLAIWLHRAKDELQCG